jgi:hypothetical protein
VWCEVSDNILIALHVIEEHLTAPYYRNFLEEESSLSLENVSLQHEGERGYNMTGYPQFRSTDNGIFEGKL